MNKTLYITKGLPGSGKSTWAREFVDQSNGQVLNICKDDLRAMLNNKHHSKHREHYIQRIRDMITIDALENGYSVIWSDTNLHPIHQERAMEISKSLKVSFKIIDFTNVDIETCIRQDLKRFDSVGEKVIRENYRKFLKPLEEKIIQDKNLPKSIICDLDGTLAGIDHRNPYDASTCENDELNEAVANVLKIYFEKGYKIFLVSGRKEEYREPTLRWLQKHKINFNDLLMRKHKDTRKDSLVKKDIYEDFFKDKYYIEFILDDRPQVIRMWRDLGLTVFQLNDEEF